MTESTGVPNVPQGVPDLGDVEREHERLGEQGVALPDDTEPEDEGTEPESHEAEDSDESPPGAV